MTSRRIALATSATFPDLAPDDHLLANWLSSQGHEVRIKIWDEPEDWRQFDAVVVRSCWDYHEKRQRFIEWIDTVEAAGVRLLNPPALLRWNHDKSYLQELKKNGIPTVATEWLSRRAAANLQEVLQRRGWPRAVIKPRVSATAWRTSTTSLESAVEDQAALTELLHDEDVMVQPFLEEIVTHGELSFIYFNGERSHVVLKRARQGDFRVQEEFAGTVETVPTNDALWQQADAVIATLDSTALYARVDGPVLGDRLHVLEFELIEPALYLAFDKLAAARFGAAVLAWLEPNVL